MQIVVISFGKLKTPGTQELTRYYQKLLNPWIKINEIELKSISIPDKNPSTKLQIKEQERKILLNLIQKETFKKVILLDENGKNHPTQIWAKHLDDWGSLYSANQKIAFVIGGSLGLDASILNAFDSWSLGAQTTSHELARVLLFEQLYRALSILKKHPYHNG